MLEIPLYYFLIIYAVCFGIFLIFMFFNFYHIYSTGTFTIPVLLVFIVVMVLTAATLIATVIMLKDASWVESVRFGVSNVFI